MKIIRKPIDVIAVFKQGQLPMPYKIKLETGECIEVVKIDRVMMATKQKNVGKEEVVYVCQGIVDGTEKTFELKYLVGSLAWILYKM